MVDDAEEDEDSSSSSPPLVILQTKIHHLSDEDPLPPISNNLDELERFRSAWRRELEFDELAGNEENSPLVKQRQDQLSSTDLYNRAVWHEQNGRVTEAVNLYRRAFKLFPEVEERFYNNSSGGRPPSALQDGNVSANVNDSTKNQTSTRNFEDNNQNSNVDDKTLDAQCLKVGLPVDQNTRRILYCLPARKTKTLSLHIGNLPSELLVHIFKWVVSSHMDVRQLEQLSMVCRGFYVLCRDPELWKLICLRTWPQNDTINSPTTVLKNNDTVERSNSFGFSWRQVYLDRPHLLYTGVYISKISYIRQGEDNSFQDRGFYQQWHLVSYFRYLRFFADGSVAMITSADEPVTVLPGLKSRSSLASTAFVGTYTVTMNGDDKNTGHVTAIVRRVGRKSGKDVMTSQNRHLIDRSAESDQTFLMEFLVKPMKKHGHFQLVWQEYLVKILYSNGHETTNRIAVTAQNFPPLHFSRVRSYTDSCQAILA